MVGPWFELLVLDPTEVESLLGQASFRLLDSIDWEGSMIYIARRQAKVRPGFQLGSEGGQGTSGNRPKPADSRARE
jgi:hypothetical protein